MDVIKNSTQCEHDILNPFASVKTGEGCLVTGSMQVNKVAGNFHIAHGDSIVRDGRHIHQFVPAEAPHYNISHTIHRYLSIHLSIYLSINLTLYLSIYLSIYLYS
jgi:hypothetical protein